MFFFWSPSTVVQNPEIERKTPDNAKRQIERKEKGLDAKNNECYFDIRSQNCM
jgi:hypothetical protein